MERAQQLRSVAHSSRNDQRGETTRATNLLLQEVGAEVDDGREADAETATEAPDEAAGSTAGHLVGQDETVERIPVLGAGADKLLGPCARQQGTLQGLVVR